MAIGIIHIIEAHRVKEEQDKLLKLELSKMTKEELLVYIAMKLS